MRTVNDERVAGWVAMCVTVARLDNPSGDSRRLIDTCPGANAPV